MKPELLMPAGNFQKLQYALAFGADAVYAGVPKFSLRARENQFKTEEDLIQAIEYTHGIGKKIYLTTNILPHNRKLDSFLDSLKTLYPHKPDGFITADPGLIMMMQDTFPDIEIHLSVQANAVNWASAKFWYKQGVKRLILSRELSISEISEIHDKVPGLELEAFVHGSICIAYSGRCLLSNYFNHRDANQGTCTNSCRWTYNVHQRDLANGTQIDDKPVLDSSFRELSGDYYLEQTDRPGELMPVDEDEFGTYIMNAKDLMALEYLEELKNAGVMSFKIEGRSKTVYYASRIAHIYRKAIDAIDAGKKIDQNLMDEVLSVANRGYTTGFLKGNPHEYGQNYNSGRPEYDSEKYVARVAGYDPESKEVILDIKNKITLGETVNIITPEREFELRVEKLTEANGSKLSAVSGGVNNIRMNCPTDPGPFAVATISLTRLNVLN